MFLEVKIVDEASLDVEPVVIEGAASDAEHIGSAIEAELGQDGLAGLPVRHQDAIGHQSPLKDDEHDLINAPLPGIVRVDTKHRVMEVQHLAKVIMLQVGSLLTVPLQTMVLVSLRVRIVLEYQLLQVVNHLRTVHFKSDDRRGLCHCRKDLRGARESILEQLTLLIGLPHFDEGRVNLVLEEGDARQPELFGHHRVLHFVLHELSAYFFHHGLDGAVCRDQGFRFLLGVRQFLTKSGEHNHEKYINNKVND